MGRPGTLCLRQIHKNLLGKTLTFSFGADINLDDIYLFNSQLDFIQRAHTLHKDYFAYLSTGETN